MVTPTCIGRFIEILAALVSSFSCVFSIPLLIHCAQWYYSGISHEEIRRKEDARHMLPWVCVSLVVFAFTYR